MTEQYWKAAQELNKTPLSQACKGLLENPLEDGSLFLLQALLEALEMSEPPYQRHMAPMMWNVRDSMTELLYSFLANNPKGVYRLLTTDEDEETCDSDLLTMVNKEVERDDKLWCLLDSAECNLEANGYNLSGVYPTTD